MRKRAVDRLYDLISGDKGVRVSTGVDDGARDAIPRNFFLQLTVRLLAKLGDTLGSPGLVLAWIFSAISAPVYLIGVLVPLREAGSLLPQMVFGGVLQRYSIRKWFWVLGGILQGLAVLGMALVVFVSTGAAAAWTIVALLAVFSLSRGISSLTSKDLLGKTIPKTRRGRLTGLAATGAGVITGVVGLWLVSRSGEERAASSLAYLLLVAGGFWFLAAAAMAALDEPPGTTSGKSSPLKMAVRSLALLRADPTFRRFCVARALLASTVLSMPFYVVLAQDATEGRSATLGLLMIAGSSATAVSGVAWGWLADRSSRLTLAAAGLFSALVGFATFALSLLEVEPPAATWLYGVLFFAIGLGHTGIRLGRKIYLVDLAPADERPAYVALSNTLIGVVLLLTGSLGGLSVWLGARGIVLIFAALGAAGAAVALSLKELEHEG